MTDWAVIAQHIASATGQPFAPTAAARPVGGGCINDAVILTAGERSYFVKTNAAARHTMFEAEAAGLAELAAAGALRVPAPVCWGQTATRNFLVLERLELGGPTRGATAGRQLAELHRSGSATFGWSRDNFIGATPQSNTPSHDWAAFWRDQRLGFQLELAARNGYARGLQDAGEQLRCDLDAVLTHRPQPALLHGDLWGGNLGWLPDGAPVIFDPAVYYGDREADLAMTELFGGFGADFYAAYREAWPLDPGYTVRKTLYNLYHILNHLNLFGSGYLGQARGMIDRLLAEVR
ncbi:fructosamine kinase family protein [uncultured Thiodictyon sp.]|uniref:fructosamine kinase family protein n=1 Tax=uncultured Thiodictyon sp. TaxID=1846217 RepID=UPI0025D7311C|nr:fructosamine kinase family protein [uncultured Thiodictyon sp.]